MDDDLDTFLTHHKNKMNVLVHVICGYVYMSLLFSLCNRIYPNAGTFLLLCYTCCMLYKYFKYSLLFLASAFCIWNAATICEHMSITSSVILLITVYLVIPEVSHLVFNEKPVLQVDTFTYQDFVHNALNFLTYSLLAAIDK